MARPTLYQHRKFKRLCHVLGLPGPFVAGLLEYMWRPGYESGDCSFVDAMEIELAAEWPNDEGAFARAVVEVGFVDVKPGGGFEVHDFWDHCPDYVRQRWRREQKRKGRSAESSEDGEGEDSPPNGRGVVGHSGGGANRGQSRASHGGVPPLPARAFQERVPKPEPLVSAAATAGQGLGNENKGVTRQCAGVDVSVTKQCAGGGVAVLGVSASVIGTPAPAPAPARSAVHTSREYADRRSAVPVVVGDVLSAIGVFALKHPPKPGLAADCVSKGGPRVAGPWRVSEVDVAFFVPRFMDLESSENRGRGVVAGWTKRVRMALSHPGGRDELERVLNEVEARRVAFVSPLSAATRGYSVEPIRNEASWANREVNAWNARWA